ncbi:MAG: hypothetical protein ABSB33_04880 [Tepidisphaeraceae bacterium]
MSNEASAKPIRAETSTAQHIAEAAIARQPRHRSLPSGDAAVTDARQFEENHAQFRIQ